MNESVSPAESVRPFKFLVCVDRGPEAKVALRLACLKALRRGGLVAMVHVIPPADFQTIHAVADRMRQERRQEAEHLLQSLADEAYAATGTHPEFILREGKTGDEILAAVMEDHDATMLVIGAAQQNSGRGTLAGWLASQLGSRLLIPLLLVPGNLTDQQIEALI